MSCLLNCRAVSSAPGLHPSAAEGVSLGVPCLRPLPAPVHRRQRGEMRGQESSARRLQKEIQLAQKADYPANKLPQLPSYDKLSPGDQKLAQSAQMYHYQHQKQQMLSMEKHKEDTKAPEPISSDEENEDGDFTVYECPGLAPTGEMEVKNPLFDDSTLPPKLHP
ncbi:Neural proliferation differentiation and control protein 1 [Ophiophagus hannah]|uniref:Neural proliferation differentiation and control protein 1 n=1 Tax=Ophiophagus hannah TaxID=8665 RepID=V8NEQ5_OPHHA|nr:Neural proliferation differentiation and control protein 1 [Ophiophagus hannah]